MKIKKVFSGFSAFRIAFIYFFVATLWIIYSDLIIGTLFKDQELLTRYQTVKGLFFVIVTATLLFFMIKASQKKLLHAHHIIEASEKRYRLLVDQSPFIIGLVQDEQVIYGNPATSDILEIPKLELIGKGIGEIIYPDNLETVRDRLKRLLDGETGLYPALEKYVSSTGKVIPVEVYATAFTYNSKKAIQIIAIDITDRVTREEKLELALREKEVLLSEVHHRVKNNMAIISALIQLQALQEDHERTSEVLLNSIRRVGSIALIHERIYRSDDLMSIRLDKLIPELISLISRDFQQTNLEQKLSIDPVNLNVNQAVSCALFLNETLTLVFHDYPVEIENGELLVRFKQTGKTCTLSVSFSAKETVSSVIGNENAPGLQLLELIGQQLQGNFTTDTQNGMTFTLEFESDENLRGSAAHIPL